MLALFVGAAAAAAALSLSDAATTVINFEFALKLVSEHVHLGSPHTSIGGHPGENSGSSLSQQQQQQH